MSWIACYTNDDLESDWEHFETEKEALEWLEKMKDTYGFDDDNIMIDFKGYVANTTHHVKEIILGKREDYANQDEFEEKFNVSRNIDIVVQYEIERKGVL